MTSPAEAKRDRMAGYRRLDEDELERILAGQTRRLDAGRAEERAIVTRWAEVHKVVGILSVTTQEIAQVLLEKRGRR